MLHVRILPVRLQRANKRRSYRSAGGHSYSAWNRLIKSGCGRNGSGSAGNCTDAECFLIWRIQSDVLFPRPVQNLIVVDAVAGANRSPAFAKRIPGNAKTRAEVAFGSLQEIFSVWRDRGYTAISSGLNILRIRNYTVAEIPCADYSIAG